MRVLVACEESQRVCIEFRKRGHEAFSCDVVIIYSVNFAGTGSTGGCGYGEPQIITACHDLRQHGAFANAGSAGNHKQLTFAQISSSSKVTSALSCQRA